MTWLGNTLYESDSATRHFYTGTCPCQSVWRQHHLASRLRPLPNVCRTYLHRLQRPRVDCRVFSSRRSPTLDVVDGSCHQIWTQKYVRRRIDRERGQRALWLVQTLHTKGGRLWDVKRGVRGVKIRVFRFIQCISKSCHSNINFICISSYFKTVSVQMAHFCSKVGHIKENLQSLKRILINK